MNFLDKKVEEILKNHSSGEDFFNHLDDMIRGHKSIIDATWDKLVQWCYDEHLWVNRGIPTFGWNGLILTGAFGRAVFNYMPYELRKTFEQGGKTKYLCSIDTSLVFGRPDICFYFKK